METRQGKIEEKFLKFATNKAPYATFVIEGLKYNTFDKEIIDGFNPGDFVEMTGEQKGQYWTMQTMKKVVATPGYPKMIDAPNVNAKEYHLSPEEVKCRALECAIEIKGGNYAFYRDTPLIDVADSFVEWIYNGKSN